MLKPTPIFTLVTQIIEAHIEGRGKFMHCKIIEFKRARFRNVTRNVEHFFAHSSACTDKLSPARIPHLLFERRCQYTV